MKVKCERCNGVGEFRWSLEDGGSPWMICPDCGGTGKIEPPTVDLAIPDSLVAETLARR